VRSANNGISVVDAAGHYNDSMLAASSTQCSSAVAPTPYARIGDRTFVALALIFLAAATLLTRRQSN
jgi:MYXO-CTERM domain-containing protein